MRCKRIVIHICVMAVLLPALPLSAEHLIPSDIVNRLDEYEIESIETYIGIALDTMPDSGNQPWYSSNNQANGDIKIIRSFEFNFQSCREIQITIKTNSYTDQRTFNYCHVGDFLWQPLTYKRNNPE